MEDDDPFDHHIIVEDEEEEEEEAYLHPLELGMIGLTRRRVHRLPTALLFDEDTEAPPWQYTEHQIHSTRSRKQHLEQAVRRFIRKPISSSRRASLTSSVVNLVNTTIGAGVLALPGAFRDAGMILGIIFLAVIAIMQAMSSRLLVRANRLSSAQETFSGTCVKALGRWAGYVISGCVFIQGWSILVIYIIILGSLLPSIALVIGLALNREAVMITLTVLCILPLSLLKRFDSLRFASLIAVACISYLVIAVIILSFYHTSQWATVPLFRLSSDAFLSLAVLGTAFTNQANLFPAIRELNQPTFERIHRTIWFTQATCSIVYFFVAVFGVLAFGDSTPSIILSAYSSGVIINLGRFLYTIVLIVSYPVVAFPVRSALDTMIFRDESLPTPFRYAVQTVIIVFSSLLVAIFVSDVTAVLGLVGSTAAPTIAYLFPGLAYYRVAHPKLFSSPWRLTITILLMGIVCIVAGLWASVSHMLE